MMDAAIARRIARRSHRGQRNRFGELVIDNVERVADAVGGEARTTALLHDVIELTPIQPNALHTWGLAPSALAALELLTRPSDGPYASCRRSIAGAHGAA